MKNIFVLIVVVFSLLFMLVYFKDKAIRYETFTYEVTAYCGCSECTGPFDDMVTASGYHILWKDRFVAASENLAFGTHVKVPGYNKGKAVLVRDRGGSVGSGRLEVYFDEHQEALEWGRQTLEVEIENTQI